MAEKTNTKVQADIEGRLDNVERKLRVLGGLFGCCDDIVSLRLNCDQLNGLSIMIDEYAEEIACINQDVVEHFQDLEATG